MFADPEEEKCKERQCQLARKEKSLQQAVLAIKKKYGRNAMLRGMNFLPGATAIERNGQVGGHKDTLDEAPMAYKSLSDILDVIGDTVEVIDVMKPVYNFKAAEK